MARRGPNRGEHDDPTAQDISAADKKDLRQEAAGIRGLTLLFEDDAYERKWNQTHLQRMVRMTTRYMFACAAFQVIFFCSDLVEYGGFHDDTSTEMLSLKKLGAIRFALGFIPLLCCLSVAKAWVVPTQMIVWSIGVLYGLPSLWCFYMTRRRVSHWDSLFIIYGMMYFMLPKISPLNFIYGFMGSALFVFGYCVTSLFRLPLNSWLLSNVLLLSPYSLMCYLSYSMERNSRERWLLRERLKREKINLRIVASSIQDDFARAANESNTDQSVGGGSKRRTTLVSPPSSFSVLMDRQRNAFALLKTLGGGKQSPAPASTSSTSATVKTTAQHGLTTAAGDDSGDFAIEGDFSSSHSTHSTTINTTSATATTQQQKQNLVLFFKGLAAWSLTYLFGYTFDMVAEPDTALHSSTDTLSIVGSTISTGEVNSSAAFALLMHSMGFSVFLLYVTGQVRWLALNGVVGLAMLWAFNHTGMENRWIVFSTHSVGYLLLGVVIVIMVLVFGGVVLVWSNLIEFIRDILARYPQVKDELKENKLLEQVLIRYVAELPQVQNVGHGGGDNGKLGAGSTGSRLEVYRQAPTADEEEQDGGAAVRLLTSQPSVSDIPHSTSGGGLRRGSGNSSRNSSGNRLSDPGLSGCNVLHTRRLGMCFFCLKQPQSCLIPACAGWDPSRDSGSGGGGPGVSMCTPYTELAKARDDALARMQALELECDELRARLARHEGAHNKR